MSFEIVYQLRRFLDNLTQEYEGRSLNCRPSAYDPRDYKYRNIAFQAPEASAKPKPIDYRTVMPPVFDQGQRGTCVACAAAWTLKAYEEVKQGDYPAGGMSVSFLYTMCKQNDGMPNEEGTQPRIAMKILQKYGVCTEEIMPYSVLEDLPVPEVPPIPDNAPGAALRFRVKTYAQLCSAYDNDRSQAIQVMRQALDREGPFMIALLVTENFHPGADLRLPLPAGPILGGHAVGIVGDLPDQNCFVLRNSWGKEWGEDGYAYLPYEWITQQGEVGWHVFEAWTATDLTAPGTAKNIVLAPGNRIMTIDGRRVVLSAPVFTGQFPPLPPTFEVVAAHMGYRLSQEGRKIIFTRIGQ